jgi:3-hydroxyisobutyrate dehydrogenase
MSQIVAPDVPIGWIGTGIMGSLMCGHLLDAGYATTIYSRRRASAESLLARGAAWAPSPAEVGAASEVVFSMVGAPADVRKVLLGPSGALAGARPGSVIVDMTTSEPSLAVEIHSAARARGVDSIDAPVSGLDIGARSATLSIMVGGDAAAVARVRPLFELMGRTIIHQGDAGSGQHTKMVNQILFASGIVGVCEALLYGYRARLDLATVLESVGGGAAGSAALTNLAPRMLSGDYAPGFSVTHFLKDLDIALSEARRLDLALPGLALAHQLYVALKAQNGGAQGTQALVLALARISNIDWLGDDPAAQEATH